jgi:hypothetical protein
VVLPVEIVSPAGAPAPLVGDGDEPAGVPTPDFAYNSALWTELDGGFGYTDTAGGTLADLTALGKLDLVLFPGLDAVPIKTATITRFARPVSPGLTSSSPLGIGAAVEIFALEAETPEAGAQAFAVLPQSFLFGQAIEGSGVGIPNEVEVVYGNPGATGADLRSAVSRFGTNALFVTFANLEGEPADVNDLRRLTGDWWQRYFDAQESGEPTPGQRAPRLDGPAQDAYFMLNGEAVPLLDDEAVASDLLERPLKFGAGYVEVLVESKDVYPIVSLFAVNQLAPEGAAVGTTVADFADAETAASFVAALPGFVDAVAREISETVDVEETTAGDVAVVGTDADGAPFYSLARQFGNSVVTVRVAVPGADQPEAAACRDAARENAEALILAYERRLSSPEGIARLARTLDVCFR